MSLDNIQLPPIVIQELFKYSLIDLQTEQVPEVKSAQISFPVLGNNGKNILIIVNSDNAIYLPDDQLNFLLGILSACNLTMDDVAILNIKKSKEVNYKTLAVGLRPEKIFLFGVKPGQISLPLDFPDYQIQQFNQQTYLSAPMLSLLQDDKAEKTKLWNCLKQVFSI
ncbi:MAG: hypothetical protein ABIN67_11270 [Ferruginibacter sp.]